MRTLPRLMITAPASGGGKTVVTCGLLRLWAEAGKRPAAFKAGPDYIDPMFHSCAAGEAGRNLDLFFTGEAAVRSLLLRGAQHSGVAVLEGAMGFYDGVGGGERASSYELAKATATPAVLLLEVRGASLSLGAVLHGFASFCPDSHIGGVILNRCSGALYGRLAPMLEERTGIPVLGRLPGDERFSLESRHLGLVTAEEVWDLQSRIAHIAETLRETLDMERLWELACSAPPLDDSPYTTRSAIQSRPRLAVARDEAFCFYYRENLEMLAELGAELVFFSPLRDRKLPERIHGLYLGGGYPELHAGQLSENAGMRRAVLEAIGAGMPAVAECGGYLYLLERLEGQDGAVYPMVGACSGEGHREERLRRFGYIHLTAQEDTLYGGRGSAIPAHEFHYWHGTEKDGAFAAEKPGRATGWPCMVAEKNLVAGFPHLYYPANPDFARNFVLAMAAYEAGDKEREI